MDNKKREMEEFIEKLVFHKWLILQPVDNSSCPKISLSPRCVMELKNYLNDEFPEFIFNCSLCKEIVTKASILYSTEKNIHLLGILLRG